jgi:predicted nucleic acid-binding Zn finger protein
MESLSKNGVRYRTKLLTEDRAKRFAACLRGNSRFTDVEVEESGRARNWYQRHFVSYSPVNEERQQEMLDRQRDARQARAGDEGRDYVFVLDQDSIQPFCWVFNPKSGETYEVTLFDCSCPDFRYRCRGTGVRCKHMLALAAAVESGEVTTW